MELATAIPAAASVVSALAAGYFSLRSGSARAAAEASAAKVGRIVGRQESVNDPFVDLVRRVMDSQRTGTAVTEDETRQVLGEVLTWSQLYGSDRTVRAAHRMMQGTFKSAPAPVTLRLMSELVLSMRYDVQGETDVGLVDLLGLRINDLYDGDFAKRLREPLRRQCLAEGWTPPWPPDYDN